MPVTRKMQQIKICLVILFLARKKFYAKQIFVLTGFMKLGPDWNNKLINQSINQS